jgi:hypothetical protein
VVEQHPDNDGILAVGRHRHHVVSALDEVAQVRSLA